MTTFDMENKKSRIFTEAELKSLRERVEGSKKDPTGIFSARVKPKIEELLYYWFKERGKLDKIVTTDKELSETLQKSEPNSVILFIEGNDH